MHCSKKSDGVKVAFRSLKATCKMLVKLTLTAKHTSRFVKKSIFLPSCKIDFRYLELGYKSFDILSSSDLLKDNLIVFHFLQVMPAFDSVLK